MSAEEFISKQLPERQKLLTSIHQTIIKEDKTVNAVIGLMMGKEMIMYSCAGNFKYGLASVQNHMTLHLLPMYSSPEIYSKYKALLPDAAFQKGCINFKNDKEISLNIVKQLIHDCSRIDLVAIREQYIKSKKEKLKK